VATKELRELKMRTDSLEHAMKYKDQYMESVKKVLGGDATVKLDTSALNIPEPEKSTE